MDSSWNFEPLSSILRQNLAPVAPCKVFEKFTFSSISSQIAQMCPRFEFFENFARSHKGEFLSYKAENVLKISGKVYTFRLE